MQAGVGLCFGSLAATVIQVVFVVYLLIVTCRDTEGTLSYHHCEKTPLKVAAVAVEFVPFSLSPFNFSLYLLVQFYRFCQASRFILNILPND